MLNNSGNLIKGNSYTLSADYQTLTGGTRIMKVASKASCALDYWQDSSGGDGTVSFSPPWQPTVAGTYVIYCAMTRPSVDSCSGYATCDGGAGCSWNNDYITVNVDSPASCTLSLNSPAAINVGGTTTLTATTHPTGGTISKVVFTSGTTSKVTVNPATDTTNPYQTIATGKAAGNSTITATATMNTGTTCSTTRVVTVNTPSCTLSLNSPPAIYIGGTTTLTATTTPTGGTISKVVFTSGTTSKVTVNPATDTTSLYQSVATGVAAGTSTITATATMNTGATCNKTAVVTVKTPSCTLALTPATANMIMGGATQNLTATVTPVGDTVTNVAFASNNTNVATVSPGTDSTVPYNTAVTAVSNGSATVTATATMNLGGTCSATSAITVPACNITLSPIAKTLAAGQTAGFAVTIVNNSIVPSEITFTSNNTNSVTVNPPSDNTPLNGYTTVATAVNSPGASITASAMLGGVAKCSATSSITVNNSDSWWQVKNGDVSTNGDLKSTVPASATVPYFDDKDTVGGYPGIPAYGFGNSTNLTVGTVSITDWIVNSGYNASKIYNSNYFLSSIPTGVSITMLGPTVTQTDFDNGAISSDGYYWFEYDPSANSGADLTISSAIHFGNKKTILIVKGADVYINSTINAAHGTGFFLLVAGADASGNKGGKIFVSPNVGGTNIVNGIQRANLEGIYVTDGQFSTGTNKPLTDDLQLWFRGSLAAYGGMSLQRSLGSANSTTPAELFEYAPDYALNFPTEFGTQSVNWQEVAP